MQIRNGPSTVRDDLLDCRLATLGLDEEIKNLHRELIETIRRRCMNCDVRKICELDLERDPNDPVWETYCPIMTTLISLTEALWQTH